MDLASPILTVQPVTEDTVCLLQGLDTGVDDMMIQKWLKEKAGRWMMSVGLLAVATSLVLGRIHWAHAGIPDFAQGFLTGLGIVFLLASMIMARLRRAGGCSHANGKPT